MSASMKFCRFLVSTYKKSVPGCALRCGCKLQRFYCTVADVKPHTWQLHSAVCLQRYPVISAELNEMELKYKNYLNELEIDQSLLSDHELQAIADRLKKEKAKTTESEAVSTKRGSEEDALLTIEELEDEWRTEADGFQSADRITDADRENDTTSPNRKLDKRLVLITKQKWDNKSKPYWIFPQILRVEGESMREAAERALKTHCGESVKATYMGNAPCGYHKYNLPPGLGNKGVKLFFFKANYHGGDVDLQTDVLEYKWVTLDELSEYFTPSYLDDVSDFLIDF